MEDRFKFRCFWEDDKQMYYCDDYCMPKLSKGEENIAHIMQCTGLKDKNGKLIYEGDIVKQTYKDYLYTVIWGDRASFALQENSEEEYCEEFSYGTEVEIIGNIYENPELLESVK